MPYTSTTPYIHVPDVRYRKAERTAFCRICEQEIPRGENMVSWYSSLNRGQHIHLHPRCALFLGELVVENTKDNPPVSGKETTEL